MIKLSTMARGHTGILKNVEGGHGMVHRLAEMGVRKGTALRVIQRSGPVIVEVSGHRLVIGRGMAERMWVEDQA
jgi:Fe2+ transport system protein FeoA